MRLNVCYLRALRERIHFHRLPVSSQLSFEYVAYGSINVVNTLSETFISRTMLSSTEMLTHLLAHGTFPVQILV